MGLNAHYIDVVILLPDMTDIVGVLGSSLSLSLGFFIQDEAMDVAQSATRGAHYQTDVIYLLP